MLNLIKKDEMKKEVKLLLGEPKKAILRISGPMMMGMMVQSLYNLADGAWVAGLGTGQLSAIGLFFPFFFIIVAVGVGLGAGGGSAISRRIGERNKVAADNTALHTLIGGTAISLVISILLFPLIKPLFLVFSSNERVAQLTTDYSQILVGGSFLLIFNNLANAIMHGEGDSKRPMYVQIFSAILNIILDPIFIYSFDMGIKGAAWATMASILISSLIFCYWLFFKRNTYLCLAIRNYKYNLNIIKEILGVGIPAIFAQISMSISMIFMNIVVIRVAGTDGVAILTSGWRIIMLGSIPLMGLASGVIIVCAAAFGAQKKEKLRTAFFYSIKIGLLLECTVGFFIFLFAEQVAIIFTYSEKSNNIHESLVVFLRYMVFLYPSIPFGMLSSSFFRGVNHGGKSLILTILRTIILQIPCMYIGGVVLDYGLIGIWVGIIIGNFVAVAISFFWALFTLKHIKWQKFID